MQPAAYWRAHAYHQHWLGRQGKVLAATITRVSAPDQAQLTPYSYVLVDFGEVKHSFMGAGNEIFAVGDQVTCVLRKLGTPDSRGIIPYGIKVTKV